MASNSAQIKAWRKKREAEQAAAAKLIGPGSSPRALPGQALGGAEKVGADVNAAGKKVLEGAEATGNAINKGATEAGKAVLSATGYGAWPAAWPPPPIPTPIHRLPAAGQDFRPSRGPQSIVPPPSPTGGPHPSDTTLSPEAVTANAENNTTSMTPAPSSLTPSTQGNVLTQTQINAAQDALNTVLGSNVNPDVAKSALAWFEQEQASGADSTTMQAAMYDQQWFKTAFPGIAQQVKNGLTNVMSPTDYSAGIATVREALQAMGANPNLASGALYANLIGQGISVQGITDRLALAHSQANNDIAQNPAAMGLLHQWYGVAPDPSSVAAFYMTGDPKIAGQLQEITAAVGGGAAAESAGFTKLSQGALMGMAQQGANAAALSTAAQKSVGELSLAGGGTGQHGDTATQAEILANAAGGLAPGPATGETGATATEAVNRAMAGVKAGAGGGEGGGAGQLGTPGTIGGAGFGTQ